SDMKFFKNYSTKIENSNFRNALIFGRKTYFSIPERFRSLPGRFVVVLTTNAHLIKENESLACCSSLQSALELCSKKENKIEKVLICGGEGLYKEAIEKKLLDQLTLTEIHKHYECDRFFPNIREMNEFQEIK
ncbi:MAG: hypothetical protein MHPSP_002402, partial [Paramarteilia canceri]